MPDARVFAAALTAGLFCTAAVWVATGLRPALHFTEWPWFRMAAVRGFSSDLNWRRRLSVAIDRAGWRLTADHAALLAIGLACVAAMAGLAVEPPLAPVGFAAGLSGCAVSLSSAAGRRRRRLEEELVPLLELFTLELSGGGSALSALGSVAVQVEGELATDLRRMLISSQVAGSPTFEVRLIDYSERFRIPALGTLATVLAASREFGTGTSQGVRALATDLRRGQRRELITRSRKALNHVLLPAAFGVLLPFLGILMFPAITVLQKSLR